ncbi:hypothetical protein NDU88_001203 [Pleurodeles waltl]|uniref:Uncharacterized protein n=1 Tax=Pleurodeles waltl TaxID=8319 RepID=A0AAV7LAS1_PLEWA|nr:hypothetical protein NDU88_001203 [Pleurodeles waltl]
MTASQVATPASLFSPPGALPTAGGSRCKHTTTAPRSMAAAGPLRRAVPPLRDLARTFHREGRKFPGGTIASFPTDPEEEGGVKQHIREKDVREERRSGQTSHDLGRTWPSQLRGTAETGDGEAGICLF